MPVVAVLPSSENIDTTYDTASENTKPNPENHFKAEEEESKLQQMFYPMLLTMKIFGLYFPKKRKFYQELAMHSTVCLFSDSVDVLLDKHSHKHSRYNSMGQF